MPPARPLSSSGLRALPPPSQLFDTFDADDDRRLDLDEFARGAAAIGFVWHHDPGAPHPHPTPLTPGPGPAAVYQLQHGLQCLPPQPPDSHSLTHTLTRAADVDLVFMQQQFAALDQDSSGVISFEEFCRWADPVGR